MSETIETRQIRDALKMAQSVLDSLETGPIGQLVGESGTGKSRAGRCLVEHFGAIRVCCAQGVSTKAMAARLFAAFGGEIAPGSANTLLGRLEPLVAGRLLVIDEANHLRWQQLEWLRYLADEAGMGLILIGTDLMERPFRDGRTATYLAQLASRIGAKRVRFSALTALEEVTGYMIQPFFGKVDKTTASLFHKQTGGYWRDAAELAAACRRVMAAQHLQRLTPVVVEAASNWMAPARLAA